MNIVTNVKELNTLVNFPDGYIVWVEDEQEYYMYDKDSNEWLVFIEDRV